MKNIMTLVFMFLAVNSYASEVETRYYVPEFKIVSIQPICPKPLPGRVACMAMGSKVTIETTLGGCLDTLVFSEFEEKHYKGMVELHAVGVAKADPKSASVRCIRANTVTKTVTVSTLGNVELINKTIEQ